MIGRTFSSCIDGFEGRVVTLEASKQNMLPQIVVTGLPGTVVQESRERVKASLNHLGFDTPTRKILIHLSPAETKKTGSHFDFPIAMAVLAVEGFFPASKIEKCAFLGELTLSGELRPVSHFIPLVESLLKEPSIDWILVPVDNLSESKLFSNEKIIYCRNLKEAIGFCFLGQPIEAQRSLDKPVDSPQRKTGSLIDRIVGQEYAKRILTISVSGSHPLLLEGPPGSGKTLLSHSAASLLPRLKRDEVIEVSRIYSFFGESREENDFAPFRSPHHSISSSAFLGGGTHQVIPGELSLAHRGLLFLDELPEFRRDVIEGLREPLQSGEIHLHRISRSVTLPAKFSLIAAMNPCPCGYSGCKYRACSCSSESVRNYRKRISGPILDRFALYFWMESSFKKPEAHSKDPEVMRREIQKTRLKLKELSFEEMGWNQLKAHLNRSSLQWISKLETENRIGFRRLENILRVGLTISILENQETISTAELEEAWSLRSPETLTQ